MTFDGRPMSRMNTQNHHLKPRTLFLATLLAVFLSEAAVMLLLDSLPAFPPLGEALLDACLLSLVLVPFLYLFFLNPLLTNLRRQSQAEAERDKIRQINRIKSEIISVAAHELRTPLAVITGYAEMLQMEDQFDAAARREFTAVILHKGETMQRLIDELLDLSHVEQGRSLRIQKERNDIAATVTGVLDDYRRKYPGHSFELRLPAGPVLLCFDKVRIEQVIDNLLNNAIKFSPREAPLEIEGALLERAFRLGIRDRGVGMSAEQVRQVFDRFYRVDTSDTSRAGLGLGMTIAREIILAHGGEIWLESTPGVGTTAYFTLPLD